MYNIINWGLDHVFPHRESRDEYLIRTHLVFTGISRSIPRLRSGTEWVWAVFLNLMNGDDIFQCATRNQVPVEEIQAVIAYARRNPQYIRDNLSANNHLIRPRSQFRLLFV